jgi:hypothetical protein
MKRVLLACLIFAAGGATPAASQAAEFDGTYSCVKGDPDNIIEDLITIDAEHKTILWVLKRGPFRCELTISDGAIAPLTSADKCTEPGFHERLPKSPARQWVEFTDEAVIFGAAKPDKDGNITPDQRRQSNLFHPKTGLFEQTNGNQLHCHLLPAR